jgi:hypothetical protein
MEFGLPPMILSRKTLEIARLGENFSYFCTRSNLCLLFLHCIGDL